MQLGFRVFYDQDGEILAMQSEMEGNVKERKELKSLNYTDLEFGSIDLSKYRIVSIDTKTKKPILEELPKRETEEEKRIRELEDMLLLELEEELGGVI